MNSFRRRNLCSAVDYHKILMMGKHFSVRFIVICMCVREYFYEEQQMYVTGKARTVLKYLVRLTLFQEAVSSIAVTAILLTAM